MNISPAQSRAARGLLRWSQAELGASANLSKGTIRDFENGLRIPSINNLDAIRRAFECAGVILVVENGLGVGVRLKFGHKHLAHGGQEAWRERDAFRLLSVNGPPAAPARAERAQKAATDEDRLTGDQVVAARELLGWTQLDLAFHLGVSETTVALFERGVRQLPALSVRELIRVFEAHGVGFARGRAGPMRKAPRGRVAPMRKPSRHAARAG
jgi:transcriptional regulator with XRE-family HTH domain